RPGTCAVFQSLDLHSDVLPYDEADQRAMRLFFENNPDTFSMYTEIRKRGMSFSTLVFYVISFSSPRNRYLLLKNISENYPKFFQWLNQRAMRSLRPLKFILDKKSISAQMAVDDSITYVTNELARNAEFRRQALTAAFFLLQTRGASVSRFYSGISSIG